MDCVDCDVDCDGVICGELDRPSVGFGLIRFLGLIVAVTTPAR